MPNQKSHWEEDLSYTGVSSVLLRNRFESIFRSVCFLNNLTVVEDTKERDKLWKIRLWLNDLRKNCLSVCRKEHNSADEFFAPF